MKSSSCASLGNILICVMLFVFDGYGAEVKIPDFTKGEKLVQAGKEALRSRMLGPTGIWADMFSQGMDHGGTRLTRQFLVSKVETGSPADGKIKSGDVILGVDRKPFDSDARKVLSAAIEKAEGGLGNLSLHVWSASQVADVTLKLKAFGVVHSATCPYACPKCEALIPVLAEQAKKAPLPPKKPEKGQGALMVPGMYALGMLASGRDDLMPDVKAYAHSLCVDSKTGQPFKFVVSDEAGECGTPVIISYSSLNTTWPLVMKLFCRPSKSWRLAHQRDKAGLEAMVTVFRAGIRTGVFTVRCWATVKSTMRP